MLSLVSLLSAAVFAQGDHTPVQDFKNRVQHYVSLKNQQGVSTKQTKSPEDLAKQRRQAIEKTQQARPAAKQGDIFTPEITDYFKKQIRATFNTPEGKKIRASLQHAEPVSDVDLQVNKPYPKNLPLQSTPPTLLLNLPPLPKGLQYRIAGSTLFLYDETSRLVVDFIRGAVV